MIRYKRGGDIVKSVISKLLYELHMRALNGKNIHIVVNWPTATKSGNPLRA